MSENENEHPSGILVGEITIRRFLVEEEGLVDYVDALDPNGDDIPLTEALGMLRLAEDSLIREAMGEAR